MDVILDTFHWAQVQELFGRVRGRELSEEGGLDGGAVAGIIIGVVFGLVCIGVLVYLYMMPVSDKEKRAMGIAAGVGATYNFPLGSSTGSQLRPLLAVFPSTTRSNNRWLIGLSSVCGISVIAAIALAVSLGEGGHGDAEGALVAVLVTFCVIAGLAAVALGLVFWNGMRKA